MRLLGICVAAFALSLFPVRLGAEPMFTGLGDLPGGWVDSSALDVSADARVVVGSGRTDTGREAFLWTQETGMWGLGVLPGGYSSNALGISGDGAVVVGECAAPGIRAVRWTQGSGMVWLGGLGTAWDASADGSVIVGQDTFGAFRWTAATGMTSLGELPGGSKSRGAYAISADGLTIVGTGTTAKGNDEAFRWTEATGMVGLGFLPGGDYSQAYGVSADGSVVVGASRNSDREYEAFRWTEETGMVGLGKMPGAYDSRATGVSADGSVVVGTSFGPFIWDPNNGKTDLETALTDDFGIDLTGWTLYAAAAVSADGLTIVGSGRNPDYETEAWIATIDASCSDGIDNDNDGLLISA